MALDRLLLETAREPVLRLYAWTRPTLSLGRFQRWDPPGDIPSVRRPSGGRAVLHGDEITYCVVLPEGGRESLRAGFCHIARGLATALKGLGIPVETCGGDRIPPSGQSPSCYTVAREGEVTARGRKLVGSAQVRRGERLLQHGSLPRRLDRAMLQRVFSESDGIDLEELGRADLAAADLARAWGEAWGWDWRLEPWTPEELSRARENSA